MNISIFASIGSQNLGDELILKNEIDLLKEEFGEDANFRVASYDFRNPLFCIANTQYFEYFPIAIKKPQNIFRNIMNLFKFIKTIIWSDIVVIGGGGIIYDHELQSVGNPLKQLLFRTRLARLFRKNIYFYGIGIDIKNTENHKILEQIFYKSWKITVRDIKSWEQLKKLGVKSEIVNDPVMNEAEGKGDILGIHSSKNFNLKKDFSKYDFREKKVGLALRSGYIGRSKDARIERLLIEELCGYIEKSGGSVVFIPHSFHESDLMANDYEFLHQFLNYDREIYASMGEVYTAYNHKMLDIVISMRLHSIILSYVYDIPQIILSYSQKTDEITKKLTK